MENSQKTEPKKKSNISIYHRKQAYSVRVNARKFIQDRGIENIGFLTLTFPDKVLDKKVAGKRFNSVSSYLFPRVFPAWQRIFDRTKSGQVHYHLLVDCGVNIRKDFDFDVYDTCLKLKKRKKIYAHFEKQVFETANENLRNIWKILKTRLPNYGFGRFELLPIRTTAEAVSDYMAKYIASAKRSTRDKGVRRIAYSQGQRKSNYKFSWNTPRGKEWRRKLKTFCEILGFENQDKIKEQYGGTWGFLLADIISDIDNIQEKIKTGEYTIKENSIICTQTGEDLLASYREKHESKIQEKQEKFYKIWKNQNIMKNQKDIDQRGILL